MSDIKLPPLPDYEIPYLDAENGFSANQMHAFATAAIEAYRQARAEPMTREQAAMLLWKHNQQFGSDLDLQQYAESNRRTIDAILEASRGAQPAVPAGWKLVPIEPTREMVNWACQDIKCFGENRWTCRDAYNALLAAAPTPPKEGGA